MAALVAVAALGSCENGLQDELDRAKRELLDAREEIEEKDREKATLEDEKAALAAAGTIASLTAAKADAEAALATAEEDLEEAEAQAVTATVTLMGKQISVLMAGGQRHDAAWFAEHEENVAAAQSLGGEPVTVFAGDGVIRAMWDGGIGIIENAAATAKIANLKTQRAFVIGAAGDSIGDLKWRLGVRAEGDGTPAATEMPAKAAYIISHAGQREVERSGLGETDNGGIASMLGEEIGAFYAWLKAKYLASPGSSTIFAGIIPVEPIGTNNTSDINGRI